MTKKKGKSLFSKTGFIPFSLKGYVVRDKTFFIVLQGVKVDKGYA